MEDTYELRLEMVPFWSTMNPNSFLRKYCKNNNVTDFHYVTDFTSLNNRSVYPDRVYDPKMEYGVSCYVFKKDNYSFQKCGQGETRKEAKFNASAHMLYALTLQDPYLQNIFMTHKEVNQSK